MEGILQGLNISTGVLAIIGAGALVGVVGFALWATDMVASFFEEPDDWSDCAQSDDQQAQDINVGDEVECGSCATLLGSDAAIAAITNGYCPKCGEDI